MLKLCYSNLQQKHLHFWVKYGLKPSSRTLSLHKELVNALTAINGGNKMKWKLQNGGKMEFKMLTKFIFDTTQHHS